MSDSSATEPRITLKVAEGLAKDVGRGIARIDPRDIAALGLEMGGVLSIQGKRETVAKVLPTYPDMRGKGIVQIDGVIRENAKVGLDDRVTLKATVGRPAATVTLVPLTAVQVPHRDRDARYLGSLFEGLPIMEGDRVRANLFGVRSRDYTVVSTSPKGVVTIQPTTMLQIKETQRGGEKHAKVSYEDIGGLQKEIQRVREMIELPLKHPQIFEHLGIDPPKGVLLYGPPGTGKTLIARVVANETEAHFLHLSGPEIMGKFYGESEKRLRDVFEEASARAPSIIFLDELDAIAPKREDMGGERQVERRVVAQLLALMDGLESRGRVIVIGATNLPDTLDSALRRPGRFDREIEIGIPDRKGRFDILQIHTRGMPLAADVDLEHVAEITHGFVGADLEALAREAAMTALRRILPILSSDFDELPYDSIMALEVTMGDFLDALKEVEPSAIREVFVEVPDVRWSQVGGLEEIKQRLIETVEWPLRYAKLFAKARTKAPKGILLHGRPGTGKTLLAKAVATESGVNFIAVKGSALMSKYVGESERAVRDLFKKARQAAPCILFLDELDALVPTRGSIGSDSHVTERVISQLLMEIDGIEELRGVVVLGATNRIDIIDPALLRAGRFDLLLEVPVPDRVSRRQILQVHTAGKPLGPDVALEALADSTEGAVGADLEAICREAALDAVREAILTSPETANVDDLAVCIGADHFDRALAIWGARTHIG